MLKALFSIISLVAILLLSVFTNAFAQSPIVDSGSGHKPEKMDMLHWLFRSLGGSTERKTVEYYYQPGFKSTFSTQLYYIALQSLLTLATIALII